jgi:thiol-disulfide isomerase/thioredoxin
MTKITRFNLFCIISLSLISLSKPSFGMLANWPDIKAGNAKITGRIINRSINDKDSIYVNITVPHPISGEYAKYKVLVGRSGEFAIDVEVETAISLISLNTSLNLGKLILVKLTNGSVSNIEIFYNPTGGLEKVDVKPKMNHHDMTQGFEVINKMIEYRSKNPAQPWYNKSPKDYLNHVRTAISERLGIINTDSLLSHELKILLSKDFYIYMYTGHVFDYEGEMKRNYRNTAIDKNAKPDIKKIDKSYFGFLKDFKLNDPAYLNCLTFLEFQQLILRNETLGLPEIGEMDISTWLASVKAIMSSLVGFDNSPYYDILAANAYGRQLSEEVRPLSQKQIQNVKNYWKKGEIAKILFRKNQHVTELAKFQSIAVVNDISSVSDSKVIETIVAKHKGKAILIDFWATWCSPCLEAMLEFRTTKNYFRNKEVAFVYLTNGSSPRKLWEEKIKGIGSEHYYLQASQWNYIMNHFDFEGIPSYLLYNKEGILINKFTSSPGSEKLKKMIDNLL